MQPSPSWMIPNNSNLTTNNSNFWPNGRLRKRKADATDLDDRNNQKVFVTEDKMVKEMQTLSLELAARNNTPTPSPENVINEAKPNEIDFIDEDDSNSDKDIDEKETCIELHKLLKDHLKHDDLQDRLINKLCDIERKKLTMQLVPYMPIHPTQLNNDKIETKNDEEVNENADLKNDNDDYLFKIPSLPTPYTVEEPCETTTKRSSTMKRSFSQSDEYNSNLSVTELKPDGHEFLSVHSSGSPYFIVEPTANYASQSTSSSSLSSNGPSIRITEFIENPTLSGDDVDDDIDMQSVSSSDTGDKMDDD